MGCARSSYSLSETDTANDFVFKKRPRNLFRSPKDDDDPKQDDNRIISVNSQQEDLVDFANSTEDREDANMSIYTFVGHDEAGKLLNHKSSGRRVEVMGYLDEENGTLELVQGARPNLDKVKIRIRDSMASPKQISIINGQDRSQLEHEKI